MPAIIDRKEYPTFRSKFLIHSTRDRYFSTLVKIKGGCKPGSLFKKRE